MDAQDLDLIRRVGVAPFLDAPRGQRPATTASLARDTGLGVETVRRRLAALAERGALRGREIWPHFGLLGLRCMTLHYRAPAGAAARDRLAKAARREGVLAVYGMVGGDACVDLCAPDDAQLWARAEALAEELGGGAPVAFVDYPLPHTKKPLTRLDWRIVQALRGRAERDLGEVAEELKVSRRTVKRRLDAMVATGAVDVVGGFDPGALEGHVVCYFLVRAAPGATREDARALLRTFETTWLTQWTPPDRALADAVLVAFAASVREATSMQKEAASLASVAAVELLLLDEAHGDPSWLDARIAAAAASPDALVPPPRGRAPPA